MQKALRVNLEPGEVAVLDAASRIFAAYIASNQLTPENEDLAIEKSVDLAARLTYQTDMRISSGAEMEDDLQNDPNYKPLG